MFTEAGAGQRLEELTRWSVCKLQLADGSVISLEA
jgi:hypothetical protein